MVEEVRSTAQRKDDRGTVRHGGEWLAIWADPKSMRSADETREASAQERAMQHRQAALAASIRSISDRADLEVSFGEPAAPGGVTLPVLKPDAGDVQALRGAADALATHLRFHDTALDDTLRPSDRRAALLFDRLERSRCYALGVRHYTGIEQNLIAHQRADLQKLDLLNAHLASLIPLGEALRMVSRDAFCGRTEPSIETPGFRIWNRWLRARFQPQLTAMTEHMNEQAAFASAARAFIDALLTALPSGGELDRRLSPTAPDRNGSTEDDAPRKASEQSASMLRDAGALVDPDEPAPEPAPLHAPVATPRPYRVFTRDYDRVVRASELSDRAALRKTRTALDKKQAQFRRDIARLTSRLQRMLMAQQMRRWEFDRDEGMIDASRLDRVVIKPGFESCYKTESSSPFLDTCVTLLIDNSGSMRGKPIETACITADILAAALERCRISTEILGFTTQNWKGGRAAKDWKAAGKPEDPGRLNDLLHIVYKDAPTPLRRARDPICAMLSPSLLKENIDGEALIWAASRLLARPEQRRILIVISDGAPVDQATLETNRDRGLLDRHLREAIGWVESDTSIELSAIGIKHDLRDFYRRSMTIDNAQDLGAVLVDALTAMLSEA